MGMVEVVIRLPKEVYENIQKIDRIIAGRRNGKTIEFALWNGVKNGTVLPKGHGRLVDADEMVKILKIDEWRSGLEETKRSAWNLRASASSAVKAL